MTAARRITGVLLKADGTVEVIISGQWQNDFFVGGPVWVKGPIMHYRLQKEQNGWKIFGLVTWDHCYE